jgi:histidyl-tRNA synthetase
VADAEMCMMAADAMEALGIKRGDYVIKVNNRKILDGVMEAAKIEPKQRLTVLRAIDKLDRLGRKGVELLLGEGRKDESGDFTKGAGLAKEASGRILDFTASRGANADATIQNLIKVIGDSKLGAEGAAELRQISAFIAASGYPDRVLIDPAVVRGLEYYTGPVYEADLAFETKDEKGNPIRFGSVGGGGRYDDLVARFTGQQVPATGFSLGVSRLYSALKLVGKAEELTATAPVVVLVLDRDRIGDYQRMTSMLRNAGIRAEMYLGTSGMKAQMKYADRRGAPLVVIQGTDEKARGEVQIKNLRLGAELARGIESREEYTEARLAQVSMKESELVTAVKEALRRK